MAEVHPGAELDQSGSLGRRCGIGWDSLQLGRPPQQGHIAGRFGRGGQQQPPGLARKRPELPVEAVFDAAG
jgi:hypothetical protein